MPAIAAPYARQLWQQFPFRFRVVRPRRTRFGDFKIGADGQTQITVNADLAPPAFLLTYIHEVAHWVVYQQYSEARKVKKTLRPPKPHGPIWQQTFQNLMAPVLNEGVFPIAFLGPLRQYMTRPAATLARHPELAQHLRPARPDTSGTALRQLAEGQAFILGKKTFVRGKLRRSRIVCKEVGTGRHYAILADALVVIHE